jgi:hypothetical protein
MCAGKGKVLLSGRDLRADPRWRMKLTFVLHDVADREHLYPIIGNTVIFVRCNFAGLASHCRRWLSQRYESSQIGIVLAVKDPAQITQIGGSNGAALYRQHHFSQSVSRLKVQTTIYASVSDFLPHWKSADTLDSPILEDEGIVLE